MSSVKILPSNPLINALTDSHLVPSNASGGGSTAVNFQQTIYSGADKTLSTADTWEDMGISVTFYVNSADDVVFLNFIYSVTRTSNESNLLSLGYKIDSDPIQLWETTAEPYQAPWTTTTHNANKPLWGIAPGSHTLKIYMKITTSTTGFSLDGSLGTLGSKPTLSVLVVK